MLSAEEVVECGSLHDVSAYASSCPEPGASHPLLCHAAPGPPLLESLRLLGSPLLHVSREDGHLSRTERIGQNNNVAEVTCLESKYSHSVAFIY